MYNFKYGQVWLVKQNNLINSKNKDVPNGTSFTHKQRKTRPMLIVSNDRNNRFSPTLNMIPLTSARDAIRGQYQLQYYWENSPSPQTVLCEQITTIDKSNCLRYLYTIAPEIMDEIKIVE